MAFKKIPKELETPTPKASEILLDNLLGLVREEGLHEYQVIIRFLGRRIAHGTQVHEIKIVRSKVLRKVEVPESLELKGGFYDLKREEERDLNFREELGMSVSQGFGDRC